MGLLARREHAVEELRGKLCRRGFDLRNVAAVIDEFRHEGLVNDRRFTEMCVRSLEKRGYGPLRVDAELRKYHIDESLMREFLDTDHPDWAAKACLARNKRFRGESPGSYQERARQARFLQYRGFTHKQIEYALDKAEDEKLADGNE